MVVLPHVLPAIASMRKKGLKLLLAVLTLTSLAAKVSFVAGELWAELLLRIVLWPGSYGLSCY
jgi:hypothetical protein